MSLELFSLVDRSGQDHGINWGTAKEQNQLWCCLCHLNIEHEKECLVYSTGAGSPTMSMPAGEGRGQRTGSCSVHEVGGLSSLGMLSSHRKDQGNWSLMSVDHSNSLNRHTYSGWSRGRWTTLHFPCTSLTVGLLEGALCSKPGFFPTKSVLSGNVITSMSRAVSARLILDPVQLTNSTIAANFFSQGLFPPGRSSSTIFSSS